MSSQFLRVCTFSRLATNLRVVYGSWPMGEPRYVGQPARTPWRSPQPAQWVATMPAPPSRRWDSVDPPLSPATLSAISTFEFEAMTPVQAATIPLFTKHHDVVVQACTGSGKTLSFLVPILEILLRRNGTWPARHVGAVVISPTRELAAQIFAVAQRLLAGVPDTVSPLHALLLVGGIHANREAETLAQSGANIVIATPGRLQSTIESNSLSLDLRTLEVLVLDEADRLLDMGFEASITAILRRLPKQRRTGLFSATQTSAVEGLIRAGLRNPSRIDVQVRRKDTTQATPLTLSNRYMVVEPDVKLAQLVALLSPQSPRRKIIVFVLTCALADYLGVVLSRLTSLKGRTIRALHGRMKPSSRTKLYAEFVADQDPCALLCTDLVARGCDVPDVDLIVQFDSPQDPDFFVHRVGRTARMGRSGDALLLVLPTETEYVDVLQVRGVPMDPTDEGPPSDGQGLTDEIRSLARSDRDVMEKGQRAFVSFVRGYKEHLCNYVFQLARLPLGRLAESFGLLFLPRMPEIHKASAAQTAGFDGPTDVDPDAIPYLEASREKQRQANLATKRAERAKAKLERERARAEALERTKAAVKARRKRKQSETQDRQAEWDDLASEVYEYKRLKRGKITMKQFEVLVGERAPNDE